MPRPPCRLFVIMAREAPVAAILRRGPSAWAHVIRWDTARDTVEHGAWFRGRLYEERCDVSPDGELFLYFALQGRRWGTSYQGAWSAVSRLPWLHALTLWPHGSTWGGGGRFLDRRRLVLRGTPEHVHPEHPLRGLAVAAGRAEFQESSGEVPGSTWSGRDHAGRLVYARGGRLFHRGEKGDRELFDFNALEPDPQPPPPAARRPLPALRQPKKKRGPR